MGIKDHVVKITSCPIEFRNITFFCFNDQFDQFSRGKTKNPTVKTAINSGEFVIYNVNTDVTN